MAAAVSYRAAWSLPGPDSHRLVDASLCEITRCSAPPPSSDVPLPGHAGTGATPVQVRHDTYAFGLLTRATTSTDAPPNAFGEAPPTSLASNLHIEGISKRIAREVQADYDEEDGESRNQD